MGEIAGSTCVTFPVGAVSGRSRVLAAVPLETGGRGVVVGETPFHPLDHTWPDQPADLGVLGVDGVEMAVRDCVTGAVRGGEFALGAGIRVRQGDEDWAWVVVHVVDSQVPVGAEVELRVDEGRRRALSAGHTGCHLMALALNAALAERWRKDVRTDGLGHPDFDQLAITSSRIVEGGSRDVYRLGKSLRKTGFTAEELEDELPEVAEDVNARMAKWVAADGAVRVEVPSPELTARRVWRCGLPEGEPGIPCGGTHLTRLGELGHAAVELRLSEAGDELVVETSVA